MRMHAQAHLSVVRCAHSAAMLPQMANTQACSCTCTRTLTQGLRQLGFSHYAAKH